MHHYGWLKTMLLLAAPLLLPLTSWGNDVVEAARRYADGGGYHWVAGNSGTPIDLVHEGEVILAKGEGSICCGLTLAVAFEVAQQRGLLEGKSAGELRVFQKAWYGDTPESRETLVVHALESLGIGHRVELEEAQPGDFVQFWRTSGSGHSVIFLEWVMEGEKAIGFTYRSSQKSTEGIGDRTEYFADAKEKQGKVLRERTYVGRLNEGKTASPTLAERLIAEGKFAEAESVLRKEVADPDAPVVDGAAAEIERLKRIRHDFSLTTDEVLAQIQQSIPDATLSDLATWRDAGKLQFRVIDGEHRYYNRAVSNLFRFSADARRRNRNPPAAPSFDQTAHIAEIIELADREHRPDVYKMSHHVTFELKLKPGHERLRPGATVRAWLPYPQEYRQQRNVRLLGSEPKHVSIAPSGSPHRTVYFKQVVSDPAVPPCFKLEFEYTTSAWAPRLDPAKVMPYDKSSPLYREYTAERLPHIALTPDVKELAASIVGDQENPLERARLLFRWVDGNIPWCAEMEYGIIDSLSAKGLAARRGDCGVQGMVFITLCRASGIPARWQSGFQLKPGAVNMHDWAEFYVEPWGWLPADASHGVRNHDDPRVQDFLCGHIDPYRLIVNLDYARPLVPEKTSLRSEPNDFQRGEVEIDGHNLYFGEWTYRYNVESKRLEE